MNLVTLYTDKKKPFPILSILFILTNIIFSICVMIKPSTRYIFTGLPNFDQFWRVITPLFIHGEVPSTIIHLTGNCLVILIFGVLVEKNLGHVRFFLLSISSYVTTQLGFMAVFHNWASGASLAVWSYSPFVLPVIFEYYQLKGKAVLKDIIFNIQAFYLVFIWIVITILSAIVGQTGTVIAHLISTGVGFIGLGMWLKEYKHSLWNQVGINVRRDKPVLMWSLSTVFLIIVLVTCFQLSKITSPFKVLKIVPVSGATIEEINRQAKTITVMFDGDMASEYSQQTSFEWSIKVKNYSFITKWATPKKLVIKFTNKFTKGQKLVITLTKLRDSRGRPLPKTIKISYE